MITTNYYKGSPPRRPPSSRARVFARPRTPRSPNARNPIPSPAKKNTARTQSMFAPVARAPSSNPLPRRVVARASPSRAPPRTRRRSSTPALDRRPRAPSLDVMHAALRRVAQRALANAPARAPSTIARRSYASDPNAPPKVPYPWHDPTNPSNWKEEHVRICDASRATATRDRSRDAETRARDRSIDPTRRECHD